MILSYTFQTQFVSQYAASHQCKANAALDGRRHRKAEKKLVAMYGGSQTARVERGLRQVAEFWQAKDGDVDVFEAFARKLS
jgi:hypothetical protein